MGVLTVIWWRDIPAQVVASTYRRASKIAHPRFQVAIDRAAIRPAVVPWTTAIAEWHKVQRSWRRLEAEATAEVADSRRPTRGDHLVTTGGAEIAPMPPPATEAAEPAAKEPG
jgi:hypothetical protein